MTDLVAMADLSLSLRVLARAVAMEAAGEVMPAPLPPGVCVECRAWPGQSHTRECLDVLGVLDDVRSIA